ncbi:hypothetical protein PGTUg99_020422 [Puccinia graminis f. sp. tritici]|uniref:Uncharacterized protein n=1 Tax=Puccinia graminis f. sp. tritici TaxID=56615 RepID=A0A5B0SDW4_PUCGR|nr:hypothetical protein PGTUg99_020422 [Puccinia graminis f. sp. tritici]
MTVNRVAERLLFRVLTSLIYISTAAISSHLNASALLQLEDSPHLILKSMFYYQEFSGLSIGFHKAHVLVLSGPSGQRILIIFDNARMKEPQEHEQNVPVTPESNWDLSERQANLNHRYPPHYK